MGADPYYALLCFAPYVTQWWTRDAWPPENSSTPKAFLDNIAVHREGIVQSRTGQGRKPLSFPKPWHATTMKRIHSGHPS